MQAKKNIAKKEAISREAIKRHKVSSRVGGATVSSSSTFRSSSIGEAPSDCNRAEELIKQLGDNVNTRLREIAEDELRELDMDVDVFDEKKRAQMEEVRLATGTKQREIAEPMRAFFRQQTSLAEKAGGGSTAPPANLQSLQSVRVGHNVNTITAVSALGVDVIALGDKSGKVYLVYLDASRDGNAAAPPSLASSSSQRNGQAQPPKAAASSAHRKVLLFPVLASGVMSIAVSDTRDAFSSISSRQLFEKTTVDTSCTSYVAAGGRDGAISIWETSSRQHKGLLWLHRKPVTGLHFRPNTSTLISVSEDHTLRVWSVPEMMASDQLFGHEGSIQACDGLRRNVCATVGDDGTMRYWKLDAATQQAYQYIRPTPGEEEEKKGKALIKTSLEAVAMLNESIILCGAIDGSLVAFDINRRRPILVKTGAHGYDFKGDGTGLEKVAIVAEKMGAGEPLLGTTAGNIPQLPNPITAVAAVPYGDVFASASYDGVVRVWQMGGVGISAKAPGRRRSDEQSVAKAEKNVPQFILLAEVPVPGLVSSLKFNWTGDVLFIAVGKEPKGGRWVVQQSALNSVYVVPLSQQGLQVVESSGAIEHLPAQLYSFCEENLNDEESENFSDEEAALSQVDDLLPEDEEDAVASPDEGRSASSLLTVNEDGTMTLNPKRIRTEEKKEKKLLKKKSLKTGKSIKVEDSSSNSRKHLKDEAASIDEKKKAKKLKAKKAEQTPVKKLKKTKK